MKLYHCRFLTDENVQAKVVEFLRGRGCDVLDVKESGRLGAGDLELIRLAFAQRRVVVTHDSDFGTLAIAAGEATVGIVYLRPGHINHKLTIRSIETLFSQEIDLTSPFLIVAEYASGRVRIRVRQT